MLLEHGAEIDRTANGTLTALSQAATSGHEAVVRLLLEKGASVNPRFITPIPLLQAAHGGHERVVRLLLEKGAKVDAKNSKGQPALLLATMNGHEAVARLLLENGADIGKLRNPNGTQFTVLHAAALGGHKGIVRLLLEKGADINAKNSGGATALMLANKNGHTAVVRLLQNFAKQKPTWFGRRRT